MAPKSVKTSQTQVVVLTAGRIPKEKSKLPTPGVGGVIRNASVPTLAKHPNTSAKAHETIVVRNRAVALNPTDHKHLDFISEAGCVLGCDYAGEVIEVGARVTRPFKIGDRVAGFVHGGNSRRRDIGAFQEVVSNNGDLHIRLPPDWTFEQGASLGLGAMTCGQAMYQSLNLPRPLSHTPPNDPKPWLLVYGGSTATGLLAMQFAKLSGFRVVATASKHSFDLCKDYGADHVFDYHNGHKCSKDIKHVTEDSLRLVLDCIADAGTAKICADAMASPDPDPDQKLLYTGLLPQESFPRRDVEAKSTLTYSVGGEAFSIGTQEYAASPEDAAFAGDWSQEVEVLIKQRKIKPVPLSYEDGGLEGVLDGLQEMREGRVSGEKLVYTIE